MMSDKIVEVESLRENEKILNKNLVELQTKYEKLEIMLNINTE